MSEFLSQGGYGFYIWWSYGLSAVTIAALVFWAAMSYTTAKERLEALTKDETP
jgi:heme exporter protein D